MSPQLKNNNTDKNKNKESNTALYNHTSTVYKNETNVHQVLRPKAGMFTAKNTVSMWYFYKRAEQKNVRFGIP